MVKDKSTKDDQPSGIEEFFVGRQYELDVLERAFSGKGRVAIIQGAAGIGKTMLAKHFTQKTNLFPGGVAYVYPHSTRSLRSVLERQLELPLREKALLGIDEAENLQAESVREVKHLLKENRKLCLLVIGRGKVDFDVGRARRVELQGFSKAEFREVIGRRLGDGASAVAEELYSLVDGHPLATLLATAAIKERTLSIDQLLRAFERFEAPGILGPDGTPYDPSLRPPAKLIVDVSQVNDELLSLLKAEPQLLRKVPPRKFEEIIAELLSRQGYAVELTPASRDGGFDIYAARSDALGRFLFLVECKQYTPPSKVGVQIVRSLYGVVQQTRATAGMVATTSFFTAAAKEFQGEVKHQISLQDFFEIKRWLGLL